MSNKMWEVQQMIDHCWVNLWHTEGKPLQFDTESEAQQELAALRKEWPVDNEPFNSAQYRVTPTWKTPMFELGYKFQVPGYKHASSKDLDLIITYRYHNGDRWRYHCGNVIAKVGEPVPDPYNTMCHVHTLGDDQYVDYCTADEEEIVNERIKG